MPALHQNLRASQRNGFLDFAVHFTQRDDVGVSVLFRPVKRAEFAIDIADVGVIDIAINEVGDNPVAAAVEILRLGQLPPAVGQRAEFFQGQMIQPQRLGRVDAPAVPDLLQQLIQ
jgi:hypothetical protein